MELQKNDHSLRPEVRYPVKKIIVAIAVSGCALGAHIFGIAAVAEAASMVTSPETTYRKCFGGDRVTCVVDGDTLWIEGAKIRIADIDAPEISEPKCATELAFGNRATDRLIELVNQGSFELRAWSGRDEDKYGRKLRVLIRDGRSLGDILVSEGLARTWTGRRQPWC
nr:thermonuclease family protein [Ciceribacter naphthalenivorans]